MGVRGGVKSLCSEGFKGSRVQAVARASTVRTSSGQIVVQPTTDVQVGDWISGRPAARGTSRPGSF